MIRKEGLSRLEGKTIRSVIINEDLSGEPYGQIFLVFTDDTYFEIYGNLQAAGGVDRGGEDAAIKYAKNFNDGRNIKGSCKEFCVSDLFC